MGYSDKPDLQPFLDRLISRSVLNDRERQAILDLPYRTEQMLPNRDFVRLGERVDHACFVVAGMVGRFDQNINGARQITAIHIPGDMPDLHSVVQPRATSALQSLSVATILRIPHSSIRSATAMFPALGEALWRDCMVDASIMSQWVVNVGRRNAKSRIAHLLCEMAMRLYPGPKASAFVFPFQVTQAQLADATGLTPLHVNRVVRTFREQKLADVRRDEVEVLDWQRLMKSGDFDPDYLQSGISPEDRPRMVPRATN